MTKYGREEVHTVNGKAGTGNTANGGRLLILKREGKILTLLYSDNNRLLRADAWEPETSVLDNIYIGKVKHVVRNIDAAFVEFAPDMLCFLPLKGCKNPILTNRVYDGRILAEDEILLQIVTEKQKAKEASASASLSFAGKYLVLTTGRLQMGYSSRLPEELKERLKNWIHENPLFADAGREYGIIFRTNVKELWEDFSPLEKELQALREEAEELLKKAPHRTCFSLLKKAPEAYLKNLQDYDSTVYDKILTDDPSVYETVSIYLKQNQPSDIEKLFFYEDELLSLSRLYSVEARLSEALERRVWLKSGGYLVFDRTEALTCIDVNSGKYVGKKNAEETYFEINMEAAREIGRQLLLRNISGIIIIDFINMQTEERRRLLMEALRSIVSGDPMKTVVVDMTPLGLVEVTRKKEKKSLWEQLHTAGKMGDQQ